jgi:transposase
MIPPDLRAEIRRLFFAEHFRVNAIAEHLRVHRDTVRRAIEVERMLASPAIRKSKLDRYMAFIEATVRDYPKIRSTRLFLMLKDRGYDGSAVQLRRIVARLRPAASRAFLALTHLPGEHGQVDWGSFGRLTVGRASRPLSVFLMTLPHSRRMFARFTLDQQRGTFRANHLRAFHDFMGVPRVLFYDNLKSAVLERIGNAIRFNPDLLELAGHCHFRPEPCNVASGWEKGSVEAGVRYLRSSFAEARHFRDLDDANAQLRRWLDEVANVRPWPGDRTRRVDEVFAEEQPLLLPLPAHDPPVAEVLARHSGKTPYLRYDLNDYSIPHALVGHELTLVVDDETVRVLDGDREVARHARSWDRARKIEDPRHFEGLLERKPKARVGHALGRLREAVPRLDEAFRLLALRGENMGANVNLLLLLLGQYGVEELRVAVDEALDRETPRASSIATILERRRRARGAPTPIPARLPDDPRVRNLRVVSHDPATYNALLTKKKAPSNDDDSSH